MNRPVERIERIERIEPLLEQLKTLWLKQPDLRLCQLLHSLTKQNDIFYVEDKGILKLIKEKLEGRIK